MDGRCDRSCWVVAGDGNSEPVISTSGERGSEKGA